MHLLDTPGFSDTHRSDASILSEIAFWLSEASQRDLRISGVIYIHSILQPRLQGSAVKGLEVFKQIIGEEAFDSCVMVSTHWDLLVHDQAQMQLGLQRHRELESLAWLDVMERGGRALALYPGNSEGALRLIDGMLGRLWRGTLRLQREINDERIELRKTSAGKILFERFEGLMQMFEERLEEVKQEIQDAIRERDERHAADLKKEFQEIKQDMRTQMEALKDLNAQMKDISIKEVKQIQEDRVKLEKLMMETQTELTRLKRQPPQVQVVKMPNMSMQQDMIRNFQNTHLPSHSSSAELIGAAAGIAGATFGAMALCSVM